MAEKEYIEREAFVESQHNIYCVNCVRRKDSKGKFVYFVGDAPCRACGIMDVLDAVEDFPAADVRPVVLCRDCKYAPIGDNDGDELEWPFNDFDGNPCPYKCSDNWYSHKPAPDFFCANGVKRSRNE